MAPSFTPLTRLSTDRQTEVVRPQQDREYPLPEHQFQEADGKEPPAEPDEAEGAMLLDANAFHLTPLQTAAPAWASAAALTGFNMAKRISATPGETIDQ